LAERRSAGRVVESGKPAVDGLPHALHLKPPARGRRGCTGGRRELRHGVSRVTALPHVSLSYKAQTAATPETKIQPGDTVEIKERYF
jgi:hypothetical protein